nr:MAG TPA: hypothetical protein [Caudoviricetes sp.]
MTFTLEFANIRTSDSQLITSVVFDWGFLCLKITSYSKSINRGKSVKSFAPNSYTFFTKIKFHLWKMKVLVFHWLKERVKMGKIVHISEIKTPLTEAIKKWRADNV